MAFYMKENVLFQLTTDHNADLPREYLQEHQIGMLPLGYTVGGVTYGRDKLMPEKDFYDAMRAGELPTTSAANFGDAKEFFSEYAKQGEDVLHIAFSSGLSGSYSAAAIAAKEVETEFPGRRIMVVDSLSASLGQGLLVHKLMQLRDQGISLEEAAVWAENSKLHVCHNFTVNDLFHLHRGGRISKATAIMGTLINIKPILHVDDNGKLVSIGKARGRKNALKALVDKMNMQVGSWKNAEVFISHGDCFEDAQYTAELIKQHFGEKEILINYINPTIGTHSGPGTLAIFFMGEKR